MNMPRTAKDKAAKLAPALKLRIHDHMVQARLTEELLIRMVRGGQGYFWIGAPGEEALGVPLGLLIDKGEPIQLVLAVGPADRQGLVRPTYGIADIDDEHPASGGTATP